MHGGTEHIFGGKFIYYSSDLYRQYLLGIMVKLPTLVNGVCLQHVSTSPLSLFPLHEHNGTLLHILYFTVVFYTLHLQ